MHAYDAPSIAVTRFVMKVVVTLNKLVVAACWGALFLLGTSSAHSQSLDEVLRMMAQNHPKLISARKEENSNRMDLETVERQRWPSITSVMRAQSGGGPTATVVLEQRYWGMGRVAHQVAKQQAAIEAAHWSLLDLQQDLTSQIVVAYIEVLHLRALASVANESIGAHQRLVEAIERRVQRNYSPEADLVLARSRLERAKFELLDINKKLQAAGLNLRNLSGGQQTVTVQALPDVTLKLHQYPTLGPAVQAAKNYAPRMHLLQTQIASSQADVKLREAQQWPDVVAGYQRIYNQTANHQGQWFVELQYQPGAGFSSQAQVASATAQVDNARENLRAFEHELATRVTSLYGDVALVNEQIPSGKALLQQLQDVATSFARQYQIGRKNWLDVLNALRERVQAQYTVIDLEHNLLAIQYKLLVATGDIQAHVR